MHEAECKQRASRRRLLLVEDERALAESLAQWFESRGFEVSGVRSLAAARSALASARFHACILDVGLPDGDGLSLLSAAPAEHAVVISAAPEPDRYERRGVRHHMAKPLDLCELARLVEWVAPPPGRPGSDC
jgi:DNA-binding response OmpR family regulator